MSDAPSDHRAENPSADHGAEPEEFDVSELVSPTAGSSSPFGDIEFPLPITATGYVHPGAHERPNLAGA